MNTYKHTQRGRLIVIALSLSSIVLTFIGCAFFKPILVGVPILLLGVWLFHSLTVEITSNELRWHFGPGLIRKRVPLREIASSQAVRTSAMEGWGIHFSRFGWLYNVSGYDAVAITLRSGKRFALGTDDPQTLLARLSENSN